MSLWVLDSLPPRYRMVSELPRMVSQLSLYSSLIWAMFWMMVLLEILRLHMVANSLVYPGKGMAANSSSMKWTWLGSGP